MHSTTNLHSRVHRLLVLPGPFPFDFHGGVRFLPEVCLYEVVSSVWVLGVLVFLSFTLSTLDSSVVMSDARISVYSCVRRMSKALSKARSFGPNSFVRAGSCLTPRMRRSLIKLSLRFIKPQCSERRIRAVQYWSILSPGSCSLLFKRYHSYVSLRCGRQRDSNLTRTSSILSALP